MSMTARQAFLLAFLAACSDGSGRCRDQACAAQDPEPSAEVDAGRTTKPPVDIPTYVLEAGVTVPITDPDAPLAVQLRVNGATTQCGACSVLVAQAMGGTAPYSYAWSDPSLSGPGPHRVCPTQPTTYSVRVTDDGERVFEGSTLPAKTAEATGDVMCTPPDADAGVALGCSTMVAMGMPQVVSESLDGAVFADTDAGQVDCSDGGVSFDFTTGAVGTVTVSTRLEQAAFRAGQRYEYIVDRLVPFTLSLDQAIDVELWGGNDHCNLAEKFVGYKLDFLTWHQSTCFTPTQDYLYLLVVVKLNGAIFNWELLTSSTTCPGCSTD
jgi:hypothetical protein